MINYLKQEAVLIQGAVQASLGCAVAFGLHLSQSQLAALLALIAAVLSLITRQVIKSNSN